MKKVLKISLFIIIFSCIIIYLPLQSYAASSVVDTYVNGIKAERPGNEFEVGTVTNIVNKVLGFLQIATGLLTVLTIASTGFRYIVETPEVKGDIRKTLLPLILGLIFVFSAATIAKFVINIGSKTENVF